MGRYSEQSAEKPISSFILILSIFLSLFSHCSVLITVLDKYIQLFSCLRFPLGGTNVSLLILHSLSLPWNSLSPLASMFLSWNCLPKMVEESLEAVPFDRTVEQVYLVFFLLSFFIFKWSNERSFFLLFSCLHCKLIVFSPFQLIFSVNWVINHFIDFPICSKLYQFKFCFALLDLLYA